jgi:hypothetical protein
MARITGAASDASSSEMSRAVIRNNRIVCTPPGDGPVNYGVSVLSSGKSPALTSAQLAMLRAIMLHDHSPTLRFTFLETSFRNDLNRPIGFIVYDAIYGLCEGGYPVLNGQCNEYYRPGNNPSGTNAATSCSGIPRHPWLPQLSPNNNDVSSSRLPRLCTAFDTFHDSCDRHRLIPAQYILGWTLRNQSHRDRVEHVLQQQKHLNCA